MQTKHYLLAISGGVDSVCLLDMVANNYNKLRTKMCFDAKWPEDFTVVHVDHGIRGADSIYDAKLVEQLARNYNVDIESVQLHLQHNASEAQAREARYDFFNKTRQHIKETTGKDTVLLTAHHKDDLLETAVLFLVRGTGWRGLSPLRDTDAIKHPLVQFTKAELTNYAISRGLNWHEDYTNHQMIYLRNRLRPVVANIDKQRREALLNLIKKQTALTHQIDNALNAMLNNQQLLQTEQSNGQIVYQISRYYMISLPQNIAIELLKKLTNKQLTTPQLHKLWLFIKLAAPRKQIAWKHVQVFTSADRKFTKLIVL